METTPHAGSSDVANDVYTNYCNYIAEIIDLPPSRWQFKSAPQYQYMLEHVSADFGNKYENAILSEFRNFAIAHRKELLDLIRRNDSIGVPIQANFEFFGRCSPTNLRYIYQSFLALNHWRSFKDAPRDILEIGGGYGGLGFYLTSVSKLLGISLSTYTVLDLAYPSQLQQKVLQQLSPPIPFKFVRSDAYQNNLKENYFLLSSYCIGEISEENRTRYIRDILPKCVHGFLVWNSTDVADLKKSVKIEDERPINNPKNKFVYF